MAELARYRIKESAQVGIHHYVASAQEPQDIAVDPDTEPSSKWFAINGPAKAAMKKLKEYRKLPQEKKEALAEERAAKEREVLEAQINREMDNRPEDEPKDAEGPLGLGNKVPPPPPIPGRQEKTDKKSVL